MTIFKTTVMTFNFMAMVLTVYSLVKNDQKKEAIGFAVWSILNAMAILL